MRTIEEINWQIKYLGKQGEPRSPLEALYYELIKAQEAEIERLRETEHQMDRIFEEMGADNLEMRAQLTWQPIETAPKDKTLILLRYSDGRVMTCYWGTFKATHWLPIPPLPDEEKDEDHEKTNSQPETDIHPPQPCGPEIY